MLNIYNLSLMTGVAPSSFKSAVVKPLLKKPHLDPGSLNIIDRHPTFPSSLKS